MLGRALGVAVVVALWPVGACAPDAPQLCPPNLRDCDVNLQTGPNGCEADITTDRLNCGVCGRECAAGQICLKGVPHCAVDTADCNQAESDGCEADLRSTETCGSCNSCQKVPRGKARCVTQGDPSYSAGIPGGCAYDCDPGWITCDDPCDTQLGTRDNCSACGDSCVLDCTSADKGCECLTGQSLCGKDCRDLSKDPRSCGECGHACILGESCIDSKCVCTRSNGCSCERPEDSLEADECAFAPQCGCELGEACYPDGFAARCGPTGQKPEGQSCEKNEECTPDHGCFGGFSEPSTCSVICRADTDCPGSVAGSCVGARENGNTFVPENSRARASVHFCSTVVGTCNPRKPQTSSDGFAACAQHETCAVEYFGPEPSSSGCAPAPTFTSADGDCQVYDCPPGAVCFGAERICRKWCEDDGDCDDGFRCQSLVADDEDAYVHLLTKTFGVCQPSQSTP